MARRESRAKHRVKRRIVGRKFSQRKRVAEMAIIEPGVATDSSSLHVDLGRCVEAGAHFERTGYGYSRSIDRSSVTATQAQVWKLGRIERDLLGYRTVS